MRKAFLIGCAMAATILTGCANSQIAVTATEDALCRAWGEYGLATRSRADTQRTQDDIGRSYAAFADACPNHTHLIP